MSTRTSVPIERDFFMNNLWTSENIQLQVAVRKSIANFKVNFKKSRKEFPFYLKSTLNMLMQICSSEEYKIKSIYFQVLSQLYLIRL